MVDAAVAGKPRGWPSPGPVREEELLALINLEDHEADEGWAMVAQRPAKRGAPALQLFLRKCPGPTGSASELRVALQLAVPATAAFEELYNCCFLHAIFPWWTWEVSTSPAPVECGNDLIRISSNDRLELLRWRRLWRGPRGAAAWLLHPAQLQGLCAACGGDGSALVLAKSRQQSGAAMLRRTTIVDVLGLTEAIFGCRIEPLGTTTSRILLYMRVPGNGLVMRTALGKLVPGPLKRLARRLNTVCCPPPALLSPEAANGTQVVGRQRSLACREVAEAPPHRRVNSRAPSRAPPSKQAVARQASTSTLETQAMHLRRAPSRAPSRSRATSRAPSRGASRGHSRGHSRASSSSDDYGDCEATFTDLREDVPDIELLSDTSHIASTLQCGACSISTAGTCRIQAFEQRACNFKTVCPPILGLQTQLN
mmetsp:Transcript_123858/g.241187  ORF Transcript_123858/g.241187 Transcript_123858/m.241187 type:complete len:426 (+) Transcript_123858:2-1279(+)